MRLGLGAGMRDGTLFGVTNQELDPIRPISRSRDGGNLGVDLDAYDGHIGASPQSVNSPCEADAHASAELKHASTYTHGSCEHRKHLPGEWFARELERVGSRTAESELD